MGPLFAIRVTASTSFEMTVTPIAHTNSNLVLFIFTLIYFLVVLYLCINPGKIGRSYRILTPLLLIILAMIIKGFVDYSGNAPSHGNQVDYNSLLEAQKALQKGLTMDAIAELLSMIVVNAIKATGVKHANQIFKQTVMSGLIAYALYMFH